MSVAHRITKNTFVLGSSNVASKLIYLVLLINITRFLGASGFGKFSFAFAFVGIFMYMADLGIGVLTTRDVAREPKKASLYLGASIVIKSVTGLITLIAIFVVSQYLGKADDVVWAIWVLGISLIFQSFSVIFLSFFRAYEKLQYDGIALLLERTIVVVLGVGLLSLGFGLRELVWVFVISNLVINIVLATILFTRFVRPSFSFDKKFISYMIKQAWPYALIGTFGLIYYQIGIVILGMVWPEDVVGWYSAGLQLVSSLIFISMVFNLSLFPLFSRYYVKAKDSLKKAATLALKIMGLIALPIAVGVTVLGRNIIQLIYSPEFLPGVPAMQILAWALLFSFLRSVLATLLNTSDRQSTSMKLTGIMTLIAVVLSLLLIPSMKMIGAAYAVLISEIFGFILFYILVTRGLFKISLLAVLWRPLLAALIMGGIVWSLRDLSVLVTIPLGALVYLGLLLAFRTFTKEEKKLLAELKIIRPSGVAFWR